MIVVDVLDPSLRPYALRAKKIISALLRHFKKQNYVVEVAVMGKKLGHTVFSFPAQASFPRPDLPARRQGPKSPPLGEIYLSPELIEKEGWHFEYMVIHGFLHLIGYDHERKNDRIAMEQLEQQLLKKLSN